MTSTTHARARAASTALIGSVLVFVVLFFGAASAYPGGTHFDHASAGHDFWRNTMCDVTRTVAIDGRPNQMGCTLARVAMIILAAGLGVLFGLLPRLFHARERAGTTVRALGAIAALGAVAVVLLPSDRFGTMHGIAIVCAGIPGLTACLVSLHAVRRERRSARAVIVLGAMALGVAAVDFGLYVAELLSGGTSQVAVAVLERIATALLLTWMLAVAHEARSGGVPDRAG